MFHQHRKYAMKKEKLKTVATVAIDRFMGASLGR